MPLSFTAAPIGAFARGSRPADSEGAGVRAPLAVAGAPRGGYAGWWRGARSKGGRPAVRPPCRSLEQRPKVVAWLQAQVERQPPPGVEPLPARQEAPGSAEPLAKPGRKRLGRKVVARQA